MNKYKSRIFKFIKNFEPELKIYFDRINRPLISTDVEEYDLYATFCFVCVIINPDLSFNIQLFTIDIFKKSKNQEIKSFFQLEIGLKNKKRV